MQCASRLSISESANSAFVMLRYRPTFQPFPGGIRMTSQLISNCEFVNGPWPCLRICEELYVKGVNDVQVKVVVRGPAIAG